MALGAAGLIIVISMLAEEDQRRIVEQRLPVVLIDPLSAPSLDIPSIGVTNWNGARDAMQHLLGLGHTRIGMVATARTPWPGRLACTATGRPWRKPVSATTRRSSAPPTSTTTRR